MTTCRIHSNAVKLVTVYAWDTSICIPDWHIFTPSYFLQMNHVLDPLPPFPELALTVMVSVRKRTFLLFFLFFDRNETISPPPKKGRWSQAFLSRSFGLISLAGDVITSSVSIRRRIPRVVHHPGSRRRGGQSCFSERVLIDEVAAQRLVVHACTLTSETAKS